MGKYAAEGRGVNAWTKRKKIYSITLVVAGVLVALAITFGFITRDQVTEFISTLGWAVGVLAGILTMLLAALARNNVEPPADN